ncbi:MAG: FG-GAP-like repeat-containing protein [Candidatus Udaeobacter sp.]
MFRRGLLTAISLLLAPAVFSQTVTRKPLPTEPLEKYDNQPAVAAPALGISPALVSHLGPYTSYQVNVDASGNNRVGDAANEPSICVDRNNPDRMSIGWRQFNSVASNFREAGFAYTTNGGTRWIAPGVLENNVFRSDPVLNSDTSGRFFYLSLLQNFFDDLWRSISGGQSWTRVGPADGGDKQWFTIDNTNSSGRGFQYQCWSTDGNNYGGRQFTRSTDGGLAWLDPINIPNSPAWGTLDVDSAGNLFIGGVNLTTGRIWCVRSTNAKNGAIVPTFDRSTAVNLGGDIVSSEPINPEGLVGQVFVAADRSGTSTNNNVYMLASVQPSGFANGSDVMFVRSTNGGITFSAPRRINDDAVNHAKWHWFGTLSVAPSGRIDVVWLDTRNAANNRDSQLFYSFSIDGGNNWSRNVAVSNSFNPSVGYPNQNKIGDYITVVSDDASANVAYAATFNGEEDIYYLRIPPLPSLTDFNTDARPDFLLYNAATRQTAVAYMNNNSPIGAAFGPTLPAGWNIVGTADFNRDGYPDYLLFNAVTRATVIWYMNNNVRLTANNGPTLPSGWSIVALGDFNRDGYPDYVLYNGNTGATVIWYMRNNVHVTSSSGPTLPAGWTLGGVADFNANQQPDYLLFNPSTHATVIWYLSGVTRVGARSGPTVVANYDLIGLADFDGNGRPDYLLYNSSTRETAIAYLNNYQLIGTATGPTIPIGWNIVAP